MKHAPEMDMQLEPKKQAFSLKMPSTELANQHGNAAMQRILKSSTTIMGFLGSTF